MDLASLAGQQSLASLKAATDFGTICRFFEEGRCVKGSACQFLHPEGREGSRRGSSRICYACGSEGHLARDCPRNSVSGLTSLAPPPGPVGIPTPMLGPLDPAALARLPSPMLGPLPTVPGPAVLFNAAAAAHAAAAASASSPFHPAAIAAVTGLEAQAAADREQIRKLEGAGVVQQLLPLPRTAGCRGPSGVTNFRLICPPCPCLSPHLSCCSPCEPARRAAGRDRVVALEAAVDDRLSPTCPAGSRSGALRTPCLCPWKRHVPSRVGILV